MTVRGPVRPGDLGMTLSHDHVLLDGWAIFATYAVIIDDEELAAAELRLYRDAGGGAVCDPTNVGLGRDPEALRRVSEASGVHIVMGAGWYRERVYPADLDVRSTDDLADQLVRELTIGVDGTGIRAGFIGEIGTERGAITPLEERVFRAAARAHRRTGCPVMTHTTHFGELALEQIALLGEEGVPADRIIVSHMGDRRDQRPLLAVAETGAWLSVDNLGFVDGLCPPRRSRRQHRLPRPGGIPGACAPRQRHVRDRPAEGERRARLRERGGAGVAAAAERGITDEQFRTMSVDNPARAFAYAAAP